MKSPICLAAVLLTSLTVSLCVGCKRSTTTADPKNENGVAAPKDDNRAIPFKSLQGGEVYFTLPADFPADVAVYPKTNVAWSHIDGGGMMVKLKSADSVEKIVAFYKGKLEEAGWKIKKPVNAPNEINLLGVKKGRTLIVTITSESKETMIQLSVNKDKN